MQALHPSCPTRGLDTLVWRAEAHAGKRFHSSCPTGPGYHSVAPNTL